MIPNQQINELTTARRVRQRPPLFSGIGQGADSPAEVLFMGLGLPQAITETQRTYRRRPRPATLTGLTSGDQGSPVELGIPSAVVIYGFPPVVENMVNDTEHRRLIVRALNATRQGKMNVVLDRTLNTYSTTTTITDARIGITSWLGFMGLDQNGATAVSAGIWVSNQTTGSVTLNHASYPVTCTVRIVIVG